MTCFSSTPPIRWSRMRSLVVPALALALTMGAVGAVQAQTPYTASPQRNFPATALYGELEIKGPTSARINGDAVTLAPGMRLFGQQGQMITPYTALAGRKLRVRYQMEAGTGLLQTAWILREAEVPPRRLWGLLGPAKQDPHEVQVGPLGVGITKDGVPGGAPAARGITGHSGIEGVRSIQGIAPMTGAR